MSNYRKRYEEYLGYKLDKDTDVHHIDHDRSNNSISNLVAIPKKLHKKYHGLEKWVKYGLDGINNCAKSDYDYYLIYYNKYANKIKDVVSQILDIKIQQDLIAQKQIAHI